MWSGHFRLRHPRVIHHLSAGQIPAAGLVLSPATSLVYGVAARTPASCASLVSLAPSLIPLSSGLFPPHLSLPPAPNLRLCGMCGHVRLYVWSLSRLCIRLCIGLCACACMCGHAVEAFAELHGHVRATVRHVRACAAPFRSSKRK